MTRTNRKTNLVRMTTLALLLALIVLLGLTPLGLIPLGFINVTILCVPVIIGTLYLDWKRGLALGFAFGMVSFYSALVKPSGLVAPLMASSPVLTAVMTFIPRLCVPLVAWFVYQHLQIKSEEKAKKNAAVIFGSLLAALIGLAVIVLLYLCGGIRLPEAGATIIYEWTRNNMLLLIGCMVLFAVICGGTAAAFVSSNGVQSMIVRHAPAAVAAVSGSLTNTVLYLGMMLLFYVLCGINSSSVLALIGGTGLIAGLSEATVAAVLVPPILTAIQKVRRS